MTKFIKWLFKTETMFLWAYAPDVFKDELIENLDKIETEE